MLSVSCNKIIFGGIPFVSFITQPTKKGGGGYDEVDLRKLLIKQVVFHELLRRDLQLSICIKRPTLVGIEFHVAINAGQQLSTKAFHQTCHSFVCYKCTRYFSKPLNKDRRLGFFLSFVIMLVWLTGWENY